MALRCVKKWCPENGVVVDPYSGSGTTMIAARILGRQFIGAECEKKYFDHSVKRYKDTMGSMCKYMEAVKG